MRGVSLLVVASVALLTAHRVMAEVFIGECTLVSSADTLTVARDGKAVRTHLYGLKVPGYGEPFAKEARGICTDLVLRRQLTVIVVNTRADGSIFGRVLLPDGKSLNQELVRLGAARWDRENAPGETQLGPLVQQAEASKIGLWAETAPEAGHAPHESSIQAVPVAETLTRPIELPATTGMEELSRSDGSHRPARSSDLDETVFATATLGVIGAVVAVAIFWLWHRAFEIAAERLVLTPRNVDTRLALVRLGKHQILHPGVTPSWMYTSDAEKTSKLLCRKLGLQATVLTGTGVFSAMAVGMLLFGSTFAFVLFAVLAALVRLISGRRKVMAFKAISTDSKRELAIVNGSVGAINVNVAGDILLIVVFLVVAWL